MNMNDPFNAVELARSAALEDAGDEKFIGKFIGAETDDLFLDTGMEVDL